jgi:hypothetical protein
MKITHFETFMANGGLRQQSTVQHTVDGASTTEPPLSGRWVLQFYGDAQLGQWFNTFEFTFKAIGGFGTAGLNILDGLR